MNREKEQIRALRASYERSSLSINDVDLDPFKQFQNWFDAALASEVVEANAMSVATVGKDGQPSVRILLLKEIEEDGYIFYTNYDSRKGEQIEENNKISLLFFWSEIEQQVRIEGVAEKIPQEHSLNYFHSRPKGSQIGAWASPQSKKISREELEANVGNITSINQNKDQLELPSNWGGYKVKPNYFEFWQGRKDRLHDRISFTLNPKNKWTIDRLAP